MQENRTIEDIEPFEENKSEKGTNNQGSDWPPDEKKDG